MTNELWGILYGLAWAVAIGLKLWYWDWPRRQRIGDPSKVLFRIRSVFPTLQVLTALLGVALVVEGAWMLPIFLAGQQDAVFGVNVVLMPLLAFLQSATVVHQRDVVTNEAVFLGGSRYELDDLSAARPRGTHRIQLVWRTPRWGIGGFSIRPVGIDRAQALEKMGPYLGAAGSQRDAGDLH